MLVSAAVQDELKRFIHAKLWTGPGEKNATENNAAQMKYGKALPLLVILDPDGNEIARLPQEGDGNFVITEAQLLEALRKIR